MKYRWIIPGICLVLFAAVLTACGSPSSGNSNEVHVTLSDFKIQSSQTTFTAGTTYHFVVANEGHTKHEFMIISPISGEFTDEMDTMALHHIDEDELAPGASKSFDFTFQPADAQKPLEFACHLPGHHEAGMHLPITVNQ